MPAYSPNPYDTAQPTEDKFVASAAAEFRALKIALEAITTNKLYRGDWSSYVVATAATRGDQFTHLGALWLLKTNVADVTLIPPSDVDTVNWFKLYQQSTDGVVTATGLTGSARMPNGTTAQRDASPSPGFTRWSTTLQCNETWNGTEWVPDRMIALASDAALSGLEYELLALPAWVKKLILNYRAVSSTVSAVSELVLGTAANYVITGYDNAAWGSGAPNAIGQNRVTTGFQISNGQANTFIMQGELELTHMGSNKWNCKGVGTVVGTQTVYGSFGTVSLAAALTRMKFSAGGGGTFDGSGTITVHAVP